ncbi:ribonuclease J (plasmid) [Pontibacillus sp. ALD_SL1]|uniref:ribonuclease J n=1 Tax=Pontibacillus sp. ALD_SL1 TaxID=2777185 RepID=UPI001A978CED|nr:ribonuclease J [Pontibacillus sp. ALD_SL1]QST03082.1 ribonuclease J [Pontibacillus sp. ALD_SL1]
MSNRINIVPLGGLEEIGKNMTIVQYDDEWFIIDAGIAFPDEDMYGVNVVIPDFDYVRRNKEKIRKIVITHAHEDHIGGLPYLLDEIDAPVFATNLTAKLIEKKLKRHKERIHVIKEDDRLEEDQCTISFFRTHHSIPDSVGVVIETPLGLVVHTGDFKFDLTPTNGQYIDFKRLGEIAGNGVVALLSDSTNTIKKGMSISEDEVRRNLEREIGACEGRVIVATFASSLHRIPSLFHVAKKLGKKVVVFGKSMEENIKIASKLGYFEDFQDILIPQKEMDRYDGKELMVITTGAQGESLAGLAKMANGKHRFVELTEGDTVVFSSSVIVGNEKQVGTLVNGLLKKGVGVIQGSHIHTSGHGHEKEQQLMLSIMRPKYFIPVHGEYKMLIQHKELAKQVGIKDENIFICENGSVIEITEEGASCKAKVKAGNVMVDDSGMGDVKKSIMRDRHRMALHGMAVINAKFDYQNKNMKVWVNLRLFGIVADYDHASLQKEAGKMIERLSRDAEDMNALKNTLYSEIGDLIHQYVKRRPLVSLYLDGYNKKRG